MRKGIGFLPIIAAISIALAGCEQSATEPPAEEAATAESGGPDAAATLADGAATGETCGTIAGIQCAAGGDFCKTAVDQCGVQDAEGTCTTKPELCPRDFNPVCGCDGETYGNACEADMAGVNVAAAGECAAAAG